MIQDKILKSKNITLRLMTLTDTENIINWRNKPRVRHNFIYQKLLTREVHLNWIKTEIDTGKAIQFIIVAGNRDIGTVYLRDIDYDNLKAEYGIFIGEDDAINFGYGTEACKLICQYGFEVLKLRKIFLRVFETNISAIHSYKKAGFIRSENMSYCKYINNEYKKIIFMNLVNSKNSAYV